MNERSNIYNFVKSKTGNTEMTRFFKKICNKSLASRNRSKIQSSRTFQFSLKHDKMIVRRDKNSRNIFSLAKKKEKKRIQDFEIGLEIEESIRDAFVSRAASFSSTRDREFNQFDLTLSKGRSSTR